MIIFLICQRVHWVTLDQSILLSKHYLPNKIVVRIKRRREEPMWVLQQKGGIKIFRLNFLTYIFCWSKCSFSVVQISINGFVKQKDPSCCDVLISPCDFYFQNSGMKWFPVCPRNRRPQIANLSNKGQTYFLLNTIFTLVSKRPLGVQHFNLTAPIDLQIFYYNKRKREKEGGCAINLNKT